MRRRATTVFDENVKGKNILTPHRHEVGWIDDDYIYELAEGTDFDRKPIFGVSILDVSHGQLTSTQDDDPMRSDLHHSLEGARERIETLIGNRR